MLYDVTIDGKNYRLDLNRADGTLVVPSRWQGSGS
jgi:hypothetical protein